MATARLVLVTALLVGATVSCGARGSDTSGGASPPTESTGPSASLTGTVMLAPTCANEPTDGSCPDLPAAHALVEVFHGATRVAHAATDRLGHWAVTVAPGSYRVTVRFAGGVPRSSVSTTVVVGADTKPLKLVLDSGLR